MLPFHVVRHFSKNIRLFSSTSLELRTKEFLKAIETRKSWDDVKPFYHPDILQIEYPNAIVKVAAVRNMADLETAAEKGSKVIQKERYEVKNLFSSGNTVILEAIWKGTLAIPLGKLKAGDDMIADFAQFYEFALDPLDGQMKIIKQRNYDCFQPFV